MYKVCLSTCNARPADMAELRKLEINLRSQIQILEQGNYASTTQILIDFVQKPIKSWNVPVSRSYTTSNRKCSDQANGQKRANLKAKNPWPSSTWSNPFAQRTSWCTVYKSVNWWTSLDDEPAKPATALIAQFNQPTDTNTFQQNHDGKEWMPRPWAPASAGMTDRNWRDHSYPRNCDHIIF